MKWGQHADRLKSLLDCSGPVDKRTPVKCHFADAVSCRPYIRPSPDPDNFIQNQAKISNKLHLVNNNKVVKSCCWERTGNMLVVGIYEESVGLQTLPVVRSGRVQRRKGFFQLIFSHFFAAAGLTLS